MGPAPTRVLFVPASGPTGSGEYFRALNLAGAIRRVVPAIEPHVVRSRDARVDEHEGWTLHELDDTPARADLQVLSIIDRLQPALAVFDGSGRTTQLRRVRQLGGRVVWISNRPSRRRRALAWRRLRWIDLHLLIGTEAGPDQWKAWDRWRARRSPATQHRVAGAILPKAGSRKLPLPLESLMSSDPAVFVSGGGGQKTAEGTPVPELFLEAAERFHQVTGRAALVVLGPQYAGRVPPSGEGGRGVSVLHFLPTELLSVVLAGSGLVVAGAGNMLSNQVIQAGRPCVMTATGGHDQPARLADYAARGAVRAAPLSADRLAEAAIALHDEMRRNPDGIGALVDGLQRLGLEDDTDRVATWLAHMAVRR